MATCVGPRVACDLAWHVTGLPSQSSASVGSGLPPGDQLAELVEASGPASGSSLSSPPSPGCFPPLAVLTDAALVPRCHTPTSPTGTADCHCRGSFTGFLGAGGCIFTAPASPSLSPETRAPYPPWALLCGATVRKTSSRDTVWLTRTARLGAQRHSCPQNCLVARDTHPPTPQPPPHSQRLGSGSRPSIKGQMAGILAFVGLIQSLSHIPWF